VLMDYSDHSRSLFSFHRNIKKNAKRKWQLNSIKLQDDHYISYSDLYQDTACMGVVSRVSNPPSILDVCNSEEGLLSWYFPFLSHSTSIQHPSEQNEEEDEEEGYSRNNTIIWSSSPMMVDELRRWELDEDLIMNSSYPSNPSHLFPSSTSSSSSLFSPHIHTTLDPSLIFMDPFRPVPSPVIQVVRRVREEVLGREVVVGEEEEEDVWMVARNHLLLDLSPLSTKGMREDGGEDNNVPMKIYDQASLRSSKPPLPIINLQSDCELVGEDVDNEEEMRDKGVELVIGREMEGVMDSLLHLLLPMLLNNTDSIDFDDDVEEEGQCGWREVLSCLNALSDDCIHRTQSHITFRQQEDCDLFPIPLSRNLMTRIHSRLISTFGVQEEEEMGRSIKKKKKSRMEEEDKGFEQDMISSLQSRMDDIISAHLPPPNSSHQEEEEEAEVKS